MGNILESDTSSSETEREDTNTEEIRTLGDGMESEKSDDIRLPTGVVADQVEELSRSLGSFDGLPSSVIQDKNKWCSGLAMKSPVLKTESPKQLPPREKLIVLKVPSKSPADPNSNNNNTSFNKMVSSSGKQKEPKFVPYEPYKGATRSMTEESVNSSHSRKPSGGSTTSNTTITTSNANVVLDSKSAAPSTSKNAESSSSNVATSTVKVKENSQNLNLELSGHSVLLLKERIKIHEKDINELRVENSRLKKMLVDSLSGFGSTPTIISNVSQTSHSKLRMDGTPEHSSMSESFDNLTDEISVWRSKFLSTCVLVEQTTKQNQDLKARINGATEIFREMKQSPDVVLTPLFFEKINSWLHQNVNNNNYNNNNTAMLNGTSSVHYDIDADDENPVLS